jgi:hypothetical protein
MADGEALGEGGAAGDGDGEGDGVWADTAM